MSIFNFLFFLEPTSLIVIVIKILINVVLESTLGCSTDVFNSTESSRDRLHGTLYGSLRYDINAPAHRYVTSWSAHYLTQGTVVQFSCPSVVLAVLGLFIVDCFF